MHKFCRVRCAIQCVHCKRGELAAAEWMFAGGTSHCPDFQQTGWQNGANALRKVVRTIQLKKWSCKELLSLICSVPTSSDYSH